VNWFGTVGAEAERDALSARVQQIGELSHACFDPPLPPPKPLGPVLEGRIRIAPGLTHDDDTFLGELDHLSVGGVELRLYDAANRYEGDDRISFAMAELPELPAGRAALVTIEDKAQCAQYENAEIQAADHLVRRARIHLRYYAEEWIDTFLG